MSTKPSSVAVSVAAVLLLAAAGTAPVLRAQAVSSATVTGRVTDQQTAIIPNARIQITAVETGAVYSVLTNADGIYTIPNLPIGAYTLQAAVAGPVNHDGCVLFAVRTDVEDTGYRGESVGVRNVVIRGVVQSDRELHSKLLQERLGVVRLVLRDCNETHTRVAVGFIHSLVERKCILAER